MQPYKTKCLIGLFYFTICKKSWNMPKLASPISSCVCRWIGEGTPKGAGGCGHWLAAFHSALIPFQKKVMHKSAEGMMQSSFTPVSDFFLGSFFAFVKDFRLSSVHSGVLAIVGEGATLG